MLIVQMCNVQMDQHDDSPCSFIYSSSSCSPSVYDIYEICGGSALLDVCSTYINVYTNMIVSAPDFW